MSKVIAGTGIGGVVAAGGAGGQQLVAVLMIAASIAWLSYGPQPVFADTAVDQLSDWSHVFDHSYNLVLDGTNPEAFNGDTSRVKCADGTQTGTIIYKLDSVASFQAAVYYQRSFSDVIVKASPDDTNWTVVKTKFSKPIPTAGEWSSTVMEPDGELPRHTKYLSFTIQSGPFDWTPQIGAVDLLYDVPPPLAPTGLTAIAAAGQAYLTWFPAAGASSYSLERRANGTTNFTVLASGIKSTDYTDLGIRSGASYIYAVYADNGVVASDDSKAASVTVDPGTTIFKDELQDWSMTADHTTDMALAQAPTGDWFAKRTADKAQTITYALPGMTTFAVNVLSTVADPSKQIGIDVSTDGNAWTPQDIACTQSTQLGTGNYESVCMPPGAKLPSLSNYVRITLGGGSGAGSVDSPQIGRVRLTYGATIVTQRKSASAD